MLRSLAHFLVIAAVTAVGTARAREPTVEWKQVTAAAGWQPRDSQGEVVFDNRMWIFGGWFNSYKNTVLACAAARAARWQACYLPAPFCL
ncbi:MAG: hypothetical protein ACTHK7_09835 [Aureliella sp.]